MAVRTERLVLDALPMSAEVLSRAAAAGVMEAAIAQLHALQMANPGRRFEIQRRVRGRDVEVVIVAGAEGGTEPQRTAERRAERKGRRGGGGGAPPRGVLREWAIKKGLRPRDGRKHANPATSVAVALQKHIAAVNKNQRGAKRALRKLVRKGGGQIRGKAAVRALGYLSRIVAQSIKRGVRS